MIEFLPESEGKTVGIRISGKLTHDDYQAMIPQLEQRFKDYGQINMMVEMGDPPFNAMELRAMWDDTVFGLPHRNDFEKFALVGDIPSWVEWGVKIGEWFTNAEIKEFDADKKDDAWQWLKDKPH